jgi:hypothetical protein
MGSGLSWAGLQDGRVHLRFLYGTEMNKVQVVFCKTYKHEFPTQLDERDKPGTPTYIWNRCFHEICDYLGQNSSLIFLT